ncbi:BatD family protein [Neotamlana laminarinivorans]
MKYELLMMNIKSKQSKILVFSLFFFLFTFFLNAQVKSSIDSTSIKIGEQITFKVEVETDTTNLVVFPEGQSFSPLEVIESYPIDTLKKTDKYNLVKKYGLTQFDSGKYTIPKQKIIIADKTFFTDSLQVEVFNVAVDTTKQGLYDIKPIIEVEKSSSDWWKTALIVLLVIAVIAALLYWFIWRKKPLTEAEQIALLPPYGRAKLALKKLDESHYLEHENLKDYYSDLTFIIRKYLDEKVYDRALESTTDELIDRLKILKQGNQVDLSNDDIKNLESILKRADLVKFAKSAPDVELAKLDRNTIDVEIDHVKEALPEPTEEEKLLDQQYREEQERKKKRQKIWLTVGIAVFLLIATLIGFSIKYGVGYVKDTIVGHPTKELLEGEWVTSDYGLPPIKITTPKVLQRHKVLLVNSKKEEDKPEDKKEKTSKNDMFYYGSMLDRFYIAVRSVAVKGEDLVALFSQDEQLAEQLNNYNEEEKKEFFLNYFIEESLKLIENEGAKDIVVKKEEITLALDNSKGLKASGSMIGKNKISGKEMSYEYQILMFAEEQAVQTIMFVYQKDDAYAPEIIDRTIQSIELKKVQE